MHFKAFPPLLFCWTSRVETQVPWMPSDHVHRQCWPPATLAYSAGRFNCAFLWKRKSRFATLSEIVGASDEAFFGSPREKYHESARVAGWALANHAFLNASLFESVAQHLANRRFLPFHFS